VTDVEADALLAPAVPVGPAVWLDLGAGDGLLTRALARRLGGGEVVAIDQAGPGIPPVAEGAAIRPLAGDVRDLARLGGVPERVDGALCANVLHFVPEAGAVLAALARRLRAGGRVVVIEYDRERGSRWVPHPIPRVALGGLASAAGLGSIEVVGERASRFGGTLYVAVLRAG
jgi:SAM-dependent methyltransferase